MAAPTQIRWIREIVSPSTKFDKACGSQMKMLKYTITNYRKQVLDVGHQYLDCQDCQTKRMKWSREAYISNSAITKYIAML